MLGCADEEDVDGQAGREASTLGSPREGVLALALSHLKTKVYTFSAQLKGN